MFFPCIAILRREHHLSQRFMAETLHISRSAYSAYETGVNTPPPEILLQLAEFYNVTMDYLFGISDRKPLADQLLPQEMRLVRLYRQLGITDRNLLLSYADALQRRK